jgi:SOUL heme-binding protein
MGIIFGKISSEIPAYRLLATGDGYFVRSYPPQVAAIYSAADLFPAPLPRQIAALGFRALAGYYGITSAPAQATPVSAKPEPIAMTAPVLLGYPAQSFAPAVELAADDTEDPMESMSFLLPAKYASVADAPVPSNPAVSLVQLPARATAVISFSGNPRPAVVREQAVKLRDLLERDGIVITGEKPVLAGYNPPFTVPWLKTNEILLDVDPSSVPTADATK